MAFTNFIFDDIRTKILHNFLKYIFFILSIIFTMF